MKKLLCAFLLTSVVSVFATTFTVSDYKAGFATVPVFYSGTMSMSNGFIDDECVAKSFKKTYKMYISICQPCLDCYYNCSEVDGNDYDTRYFNPYGLEPKGISGFAYYVIDIDKKAKEVYYLEIPFKDNISFFNYDFQMKNKQVSLWQTCQVIDEPFFYTVGLKDSKMWTFGKGSQKINLKTSIPRTFNGIASMSTWKDSSYDNSAFFNGSVKLTRNDSITKKLMAEMVSGICGNIPCEEFIQDAFFTNVLSKSYKNYSWIEVENFFNF